MSVPLTWRILCTIKLHEDYHVSNSCVNSNTNDDWSARRFWASLQARKVLQHSHSVCLLVFTFDVLHMQRNDFVLTQFWIVEQD